MKVTVCELIDAPTLLEAQWQQLIAHARANTSELILLPEMPFSRWPCAEPFAAHSAQVWQAAVLEHQQWCERIAGLNIPVAFTLPVQSAAGRFNRACLISGNQLSYGHDKYYLPDEPGFWEASWYSRGNGDFELLTVGSARLGFLICTEVWFQEHARHYAKRGVNIILNPRANYPEDQDIWQTGNRATAFVSGSYLLSSNLLPVDADASAGGWVISPDGEVLAQTTAEQPFATVELDLQLAEAAKRRYPCYVAE